MAEKKQYLDELGLKRYHQNYVSKNIKALQGLVDDNATAIDAHEALVLDEVIPSILKSAFSKVVVTDNSSTYNFESTKTVDSGKSGSDGSTFTIKAGEGITLTPDTTNLALTIASKTYSVVTQSSDGLMSSGDKSKLDRIEDEANKYILPAAGKAVIGGVFVADRDNLTLNTTTGELKLTKDNVVAALEYTPLESVPTATANNLGLIKPLKSYKNASSSLSFSEDSSSTASITVNSPSTDSGKYYAIESDKNGALFVNVPWVDTNTTYGAGRGIIPYTSNGKTYFGHRNRDSYPTASEISTKLGPTNTGTSVTLKYGDTFTVPVVSYDDYGHIITDTKESSSTSVVTQSKNITFTLPSLPSLSTEITSSSTDTEAPSSKAVYTAIYNAIDKAIASSY